MVSREYLIEQENIKEKEFCVCPKCGHKVPKNETTPCPKYKCTKCGQQMVPYGETKKPPCNPCGGKKVTKESLELYLENGEDEDNEKEEETAKKGSPKDEKEIKTKLFDFFSKNPSPPDEKVHDFAESIDIKPDELESHIYKIIGSFLGAGKSKDFKGTYDPKELEMGIKVEMEHTSDPMLAERIAKDHLVEIPGTGKGDGYYSKLKKMEVSAGIKD